MIFANAIHEKTVQVGDKTRIDMSSSFSPDGEVITLYEISIDGINYYDVTTLKYIDWVFGVEDVYNILCRASGVLTTHTKAVVINVISEEDDMLFSSDQDLVSCENDIMGFVREGRNSFKDIHREAQKRIIRRLDELKVWDKDGNKLGKTALIDIEEVNDWSKYYALEIIFGSLIDTVDDIYDKKRKAYSDLRKAAEEHSIVRIDINGDGLEDTNKQDATIMIIKQV